MIVITFLKGFLVGVLGLSIFYYLLLFLVTQDTLHPVDQFFNLQPWMSFLILGFGIQIGLYNLLKTGFRLYFTGKSDLQFAVKTSGSVTGIAMVACCAHHVIEVLPFLGLSVVALYLSEYQTELLIIGVISNILGILFMIWMIYGSPSLTQVSNMLFLKRGLGGQCE